MPGKKEQRRGPARVAMAGVTQEQDFSRTEDVAMEQKPQEMPTYEALLVRLEEMVAKLESGSLPLEASLQAFDEGVGLVRQLTARLDEMERRMLVLTGEEGGETAPLEVP